MDMISIRRKLMAQVESGGRLPAEYREVEYLESSGTQYIDTNIVLQNEKDIYIILDFLILDNATSDNCVMGASASTRNGYIGMKFPNWYNTNIEIRGYGIDANNAATLNRNSKARMVFDYKDGNQIVLLNGNTIINASNSWSAGAAIPLYIFGTSISGGGATWLAKARIYSVIITLQDVAYNFIPCYRKADSKPGMYDLVSNTFFTNAGTGEFIVGANIN